jgi:hypothetical protein
MSVAGQDGTIAAALMSFLARPTLSRGPGLTLISGKPYSIRGVGVKNVVKTDQLRYAFITGTHLLKR